MANLSGTDEWDRQMQRDFSRGGRAHSLAERVRAEVREGKFEPMAVREATDEPH